MLRPPPRSPLFPYTALFRSQRCRSDQGGRRGRPVQGRRHVLASPRGRSEEHTSELQSQSNPLSQLVLFNAAATPEISPLSLHGALPLSKVPLRPRRPPGPACPRPSACTRFASR